MTARLFHVIEPAAWERWSASGGTWEPPSLASEGFVHLSFEHQVAGTLETHYAAARALVLLEIDLGRASDALVVEPSRGTEAFPHLYRALERDDVRSARSIRPGAGGWRTFELEPD